MRCGILLLILSGCAGGLPPADITAAYHVTLCLNNCPTFLEVYKNGTRVGSRPLVTEGLRDAQDHTEALISSRPKPRPK